MIADSRDSTQRPLVQNNGGSSAQSGSPERTYFDLEEAENEHEPLWHRCTGYMFINEVGADAPLLKPWPWFLIVPFLQVFGLVACLIIASLCRKPWSVKNLWIRATSWLEWTPGSPTSLDRGNDFESMEYNPPNSAAYRSWLRQQPFGQAWDKWVVMALIGTAVGTTSFALNQTIESLFSWRELLGGYFLNWDWFGGYMLAWFCYVLLSALAALGSSLLVVKFAPAATASGVPPIMAFLNGVYVPKVLNVFTFIVKFWSCALVVAAGLPVGPEGPIIHMGAIIGAAVSGMHSTTMRFDLGIFKHLRSSKHKRDFVTAGVAAGVAAAFDAPLGGLLFAFEEVSSFWHSHLGWQVFFCCTVAVLIQNLLRSLDRELHHTGHFGFFDGNVTFKVGVEVYAHVLTIFPAAILGVFCGIFALIFTKLNLAISHWRARVVKPHQMRRLLEVVVMTLVYTGVCMLIPHFFPCRETQCTVPIWDPNATPDCPQSTQHTGNATNTPMMTNEDFALTPDPFTCPFVINPGNISQYLVHYNPMATLINPLGEHTISRLFARGVHREFGYLALWLHLAVYFVGAAWAAGMDISSGLFVPMLMIGAVLGRLMGLAMVDVVPMDPGEFWWMPAADSQWKWIDPGVFAVVGAAAFMGGVTRLTIALAAIMIEVSNDVQMLLPVLVALLTAKAFTDTIEPTSYYHAVMDASRMPFLPPTPHTQVDLDLATVRNVMADPVQTVPRVVKLMEVEAILRGTPHNGFPVVQPAAEGLVCLGLVARKHLLVLLEACVEAGTTRGVSLTFPELNRHIEDPLAASAPDGNLLLSNGMSHTGRVTIPRFMEDCELDLTRYVDRSAYMIQEDFSLGRAYSLFTSMGIRHLIVVDEVNRVRGIITRKDLTATKIGTLSSGH